MKTANKTALVIDYKVMCSAIADAALNRKAALNVELAVSCIHFVQEVGGADKTGRSNLKSIYNSSGYICMERADRDYVTVNRRITAMGKAFDKLGSSLVNTWVESAADTNSAIAAVLDGLAVHGFATLNDVEVFAGKAAAAPAAPKARGARQTSGPVVVVEEAEETPAQTGAAFDAMIAVAAIKGNMDTAAIRALCAELLEHCAAVDAAAAAPAAAPAAAVKAMGKAARKAAAAGKAAAPAPSVPDGTIVQLPVMAPAAPLQAAA